MHDRRAIKQSQHLDLNSLTVEICINDQGIWPHDAGFAWFSFGLGRADEPGKSSKPSLTLTYFYLLKRNKSHESISASLRPTEAHCCFIRVQCERRTKEFPSIWTN